MKTKTLLILWIAFLSFERGNSQSLFMEASPEIEEKVEKLLQQMTLAEKSVSSIRVMRMEWQRGRRKHRMTFTSNWKPGV